MLDHAGFTVPLDVFDATKAFYEATLAPLGYKIAHTYGPHVLGFADQDGKGAADFWLAASDEKGKKWENGKGEHVAFKADNADMVKAFHEAALKSGATCNGPPGKREYHPGYYAAFVFDPAGNNVEVVIHDHKE